MMPYSDAHRTTHSCADEGVESGWKVRIRKRIQKENSGGENENEARSRTWNGKAKEARFDYLEEMDDA